MLQFQSEAQGNSPFSQMLCAWSHAVFPLKRATLESGDCGHLFPLGDLLGERKNEAVRTSFCPVCRSLFCHHTTKPLALVSCAVSMAFCGRRLCLWSGRALQSSWVWLQGAVGLGKQCSPWLPAFSCRLSRTLALLSTCNMATLPLSSWCSWAKLELETELELSS